MNPQTSLKHQTPTNTKTLVITYDPTRDVFHTTLEGICLSATFLLHKLQWRAGQQRVQRTRVGQLQITIRGLFDGISCRITCKITAQAVHRLTQLYLENTFHQRAYPLCRQFLALQ